MLVSAINGAIRARSVLPLLLQVPVLLGIVSTLLVILWIKSIHKTYDRKKYMKLPGPTPKPLLGNADIFLGLKRSEWNKNFGRE